jgi:hypothetical protein
MDLPGRSINSDSTASIKDDESADPEITDHDITAATEDRERPAATVCESDDTTQSEPIANRGKEIGWSSNAHRGVCSE